MSNLANSYPIFESNQVLTSSQLNELVTYLDEQSRLTRVKLIGMGVACGLKPVFTASDPNYLNQPTLKITQGTGITSEGYLIKMGECTTTKYRPYELPFSVNYPPFGTPQDQNLELYELLTDGATEDPANPSLPISQSFFASDNKVIMLFIEAYDNDLGSCLSKACDDLGKSRTFTVRKLAVTQADLDNIILSNLGDASEFLFPGKYDLPEVIMPRVLFDPAAQTSKSYQEFAGAYITEAQRVYNTLFNTALPQTYSVFEPLLGPIYNNSNPLTSLQVATTLTQFMSGNPAYTPGPVYLGMQYVYDYMKDLILAYNEFRDAAFELMSQCCPDMSLFPKHLLLGEALGTGSCRPSDYRHHFLEALVTRDQKFLREKTITLHKKLVLMTQKFDLATVNNPSPATGNNPLAEAVLITPSDDKRVPLSDRAIPYYYRNDEQDSTALNLGTLEENWSYDYKRKCLGDKGLTPLSYNNQSGTVGPVTTPLYYDIDRFSFLRIEGHLRQNYMKVQEELERLKGEFDLPFNVVALRLQGQSPDEIRSRCSFNDLRTQYLSIREELLYTFKIIFDYFATLQDGAVDVKDLPKFITELINDCDSGSQYVGSILDFDNAYQSYTPTQATTGPRDSSSASTGNNIAYEETNMKARTTSTSTSAAAPNIIAAPSFVTAPRINKKMSNVRDYMLHALSELCTRLDRLMNTQLTDPPITLLPFDLADFNYGATEQSKYKSFIHTYVEAMQYAIDAKVWMNHLLDQLIRSPKNRNTAELYFVLSQYQAEAFAQLDKVIESPYHRQLELIYYTLEFRVQHLKNNDQTLFSNFIKKHPGIEHKGGVEPGGTFVIVYNGDHLSVDLEQRRNIIQQQRVVDATQRKIAALQVKPVLSGSEKIELTKGQMFVAEFTSLSAAIANPQIPSTKIDLDKEHVIADFALPYLCCTSNECSEVPTPASVEELNIPFVPTPLYVKYKLGDYAFGKDLNVAAKGSPTSAEVRINVIAMLQYDNGIDPTRIRLKLVDNGAAKHYIDPSINDNRAGQYRIMSTMSTYNAANEARTIKHGDAYVKVENQTKIPYIMYKPLHGRQGVDSFYYMFEILDDQGRVARRSTLGKITIDMYGAVAPASTGTTVSTNVNSTPSPNTQLNS